MSVSGVWLNEYGSVMAIAHHADGRVTGDYASTTGSTGRYRVSGHAASGRSDAGAAVALAISWRPYDQDEEDPVWHWASGLAGQTVEAADGGEILSLVHALVGTVPFAGFDAPATFIDKLTFRRADRAAPAREARPAAPAAAGAANLVGAWGCVEEPSVTITFAAMEADTGRLAAQIDRDGERLAASGFTDALAGGLALQSLALTAALGDGRLLALAGRASREPEEIVATALTSRGRSTAERYAGVTLSTWTLRRR